MAAGLHEIHDPGPDEQLSQGHIRWWLGHGSGQPDDDAFDLDSLTPCAALARREELLRPLLPEWFWEGPYGTTGLSIGAGRGYFERKHWTKFDHIYVIDPSDRTRLWQRHFKVWNVEILAPSLFDLSFRHRISPVARYGWIGACVHDLFSEFCGWEFMWKLAMVVSDTLIIDGGIFDAETAAGRALAESWEGEKSHRHDPAHAYRRSQFSFSSFEATIGRLWHIITEQCSPWTDDGRRTVILKRALPPPLQESELVAREQIIKYHDVPSAVFRTERGYYKRSQNISALLMYDAVSKVMGWGDMVEAAVYDGKDLTGFLVRDYGESLPGHDDPAVSERLWLAIANWALPLGLLPSDVARENIRIADGQPIWIDVDLIGLRDFDACSALWMARNLYKEYGSRPPYIRRAFYE